MSIKNIIRAWKDEDYRLNLSEAERALLPEHPAGLIELSGAEMDGVNGGVYPSSAGPILTVLTASSDRYQHHRLPRGDDVTPPCRGHRPLTPPPRRWGEGWCSTLGRMGAARLPGVGPDR